MKKLMLVLTAILLAVAVVLSLTACDLSVLLECDLLGHDWSEPTVDIAATCVDNGKSKVTCNRCGETTEGDVIPATGEHAWIDDDSVDATESTCTSDGVQPKVCSVCRAKTTVVIPTSGEHSFGELHDRIEPTCTEDGRLAYKQCKYCAKFFTEEGELIGDSETDLVIPATGEHSWQAGEITEVATCFDNGVQTYECSMCHAQKSVELDVVDHDYGDLHVAVDPTCVQDGNVAYYWCWMCEQYFDEEFELIGDDAAEIVLAATGHTWQAGEVTKEPTCTEKGAQTYECDVCHEQKSVELDVIAHIYGEFHPEIVATCLISGRKGYKQCESCLQYFTEQDVLIGDSEDDLLIPAAGSHSWEEGELTLQPTCTEKGKRTYICSVCQEEDTRDVDVIPHTLSDLYDAVEPTCVTDGKVAYYQCSMCLKYFDADRAPIDEVVLSATNEHSWDTSEGRVEWIWPDAFDGLEEIEVKVKLHCSECYDDFDTEVTAVMDGENSHEPTYEQEGRYVFIAELDVDGLVVRAEKTYTLPKLVKKCYLSITFNGVTQDDIEFEFIDGRYTLSNITINPSQGFGFYFRILFDGEYVEIDDVIASSDDKASFIPIGSDVFVLGQGACVVNITYDPETHILEITFVD